MELTVLEWFFIDLVFGVSTSLSALYVAYVFEYIYLTKQFIEDHKNIPIKSDKIYIHFPIHPIYTIYSVGAFLITIFILFFLIIPLRFYILLTIIPTGIIYSIYEYAYKKYGVVPTRLLEFIKFTFHLVKCRFKLI